VKPWSEARDPHRPRNASSRFRPDRRLGRLLRGSPALTRIKGRLPAWLIRAGKAVLTERREYEVQWSPEVRARVVAMMQEDASKFLEFCEKEPEFWTFA
jgi:hypothetical protein